MSSLFRKPDQTIQPWMFGHYETKATCLWLWGVDGVESVKTPAIGLFMRVLLR